MNKEIEEAIKQLKIIKKSIDEKYIKTRNSKAIETVLNYIENSIPKEVVKNKLEELKKEYNLAVNQTGKLIDNLIDFQRVSAKIEVVQELLED